MTKERLTAFSDGVIAIALTIMVLDLHVPHEPTIDALRPLIPVFLSYVLSFTTVGVWWNNHHHLFAAVERVNGAILWANLHLLFWLSLFSFATGWMGENHAASIPTAAYGVVLLGAAIAYSTLQRQIIASQGRDSLLSAAIGSDVKGKASLALYLLALVMAFVQPLLSDSLYVLIALLWLYPDRRIEQALQKRKEDAFRPLTRKRRPSRVFSRPRRTLKVKFDRESRSLDSKAGR